MAEMMFYERVVPLNEQVHAGLKVRPAASFAYAAAVNSVPLLASEFFECAREYPIVFARGQSGPLPAVLLGLRESENLFVDGAGKWNARYVPAFVRRYPFVPANGPGGDLLVCIDEAKLRALSKKAAQELFANGSLGAIYAHLISLGNLSGLVDRMSVRAKAGNPG